MLDEPMLSAPHAVGEECFLVPKQMHDVLAELFLSPTGELLLVTRPLAKTKVQKLNKKTHQSFSMEQRKDVI